MDTGRREFFLRGPKDEARRIEAHATDRGFVCLVETKGLTFCVGVAEGGGAPPPSTTTNAHKST